MSGLGENCQCLGLPSSGYLGGYRFCQRIRRDQKTKPVLQLLSTLSLLGTAWGSVFSLLEPILPLFESCGLWRLVEKDPQVAQTLTLVSTTEYRTQFKVGSTPTSTGGLWTGHSDWQDGDSSYGPAGSRRSIGLSQMSKNRKREKTACRPSSLARPWGDSIICDMLCRVNPPLLPSRYHSLGLRFHQATQSFVPLEPEGQHATRIASPFGRR